MTARRGLGVGVPSFGTGFFTSSHREKKRARMTSIGFHLDPRRVPEKHSSDLSGLRRGTLGLSLPKGFTGFFFFFSFSFSFLFELSTFNRRCIDIISAAITSSVYFFSLQRSHGVAITFDQKNVHRQNKLANPKRSRPYGAIKMCWPFLRFPRKASSRPREIPPIRRQ